jgi:hypothetical protein
MYLTSIGGSACVHWTKRHALKIISNMTELYPVVMRVSTGSHQFQNNSRDNRFEIILLLHSRLILHWTPIFRSSLFHLKTFVSPRDIFLGFFIFITLKLEAWSVLDSRPQSLRVEVYRILLPVGQWRKRPRVERNHTCKDRYQIYSLFSFTRTNSYYEVTFLLVCSKPSLNDSVTNN